MQYHPNHSKRRRKEEWEEERNSERESKRETKKKLRERQKGRSWVRAEKKEKGVLLLLLLLHSRENGGPEGAERCEDIGCVRGGEIGEGGRERQRKEKTLKGKRKRESLKTPQKCRRDRERRERGIPGSQPALLIYLSYLLLLRASPSATPRPPPSSRPSFPSLSVAATPFTISHFH